MSAQFATDIHDTPESHYDLIQEGPFATVSRTWTAIKDRDDGALQPQWVVVKSSTTLRKFAREPHDIVKELRLLSGMAHLNIVCVLGSFRDEEQHMLSIYMPHLPISLSSILASPYFSPHPFPPPGPHRAPSASVSSPATRESQSQSQSHEAQFIVLAKSLMLQTLSALAFLHDARRRIGHRDVKPENIMLTRDGCVKLIDFGVAWKERESDPESEAETELCAADLWPEARGRMYFEVSTRAYRAPELLFSTRNYDQCAIDLWSLGAIFAEFFTPLRLASDEGDDGDDDDDGDDSDNDEDDTEDSNANPKADRPLEPFIVPRYLRIGYPGAQWRRDTLFNGDRGEIGLAWSIFKIFGTPDKDNWPGFEDLPGATSVAFTVVPRISLLPLLPNLPPSSIVRTPSSPSSSTSAFTSATSTSSSPKTPTSRSPLIDLISRLLTYPLAQRIRAEEAMRHPWFTGSCLSLGSEIASDSGEAAPSPAPAPLPILLPKGYALDRNQGWLKDVLVHECRGRTLGDVLGDVLGMTPTTRGAMSGR